ncbi:hypothetical protein B9Z19DRAFT_429859 [Tuber borchii]|uniref:Uncharacterized protein n=1 Tax=Tuber borchii TaxID=42251 RepID=A0A2T7A3Q8_TUBBO|nr:hypothetical protein B9Z19DRAFT_429859 [Tuber borchii]
MIFATVYITTITSLLHYLTASISHVPRFIHLFQKAKTQRIASTWPGRVIFRDTPSTQTRGQGNQSQPPPPKIEAVQTAQPIMGAQHSSRMVTRRMGVRVNVPWATVRHREFKKGATHLV